MRDAPHISQPLGDAWLEGIGQGVDVVVGLRRSHEMATIGNLENIPTVLFNLWRK
jgi:hypothetical protein